MGMRVTGRADWTWTCLSVLRVLLALRFEAHPPGHLQCALRSPHPIAPDTLELYRRNELLAQRSNVRRLVQRRRSVPLKAAQACRATRAVAVLELVIVSVFFCVADNGRSTLGHARRGQRVGRGHNGRDERVSVGAEARRIAGHEGLRRRRLP
jgi:hypothetical protein